MPEHCLHYGKMKAIRKELGEEEEAERCRTFLRDASATAAAELGDF